MRLWKRSFAMNDTFLPADPASSRDEIVEALYERLKEVRRASLVKFPLEDEFELGINCRLANEAEWLEDLLDKIERS
jgi:hypothetical protein